MALGLFYSLLETDNNTIYFHESFEIKPLISRLLVPAAWLTSIGFVPFQHKCLDMCPRNRECDTDFTRMTISYFIVRQLDKFTPVT